MGREASTPARTAEIYGALFQPSLKSEALLFYEKDGEWFFTEDLDEETGIEWTASGERFEYSNINLIPAASTISFSIKNVMGKYSPGSGTIYDNVFDLNTRVKLWAGYKMASTSFDKTEILSLNQGRNTALYYLKNLGGVVVPDVANSSGQEEIYFNDLFPGAGYVGYLVNTFDSYRPGFNRVTKIQVKSNYAGFNVYYRTFDSRLQAETFKRQSTDWTVIGATTVGTSTFVVNTTKRYVQVAVIYFGVLFTDDDEIQEVNVTYQSFMEWIYKSVFYLDFPEYSDPVAPEIPSISCTGRDAFKKALEKDINIKDLTGGFSIDQLIKDACDIVGIEYSASSIADLSGFGLRTLSNGLKKITKASDVFNLSMQIANQKGFDKYFMYLMYDEAADENILFVQPRKPGFDTIFVFNRNDVQEIGYKRKNYDRLLQRLTILSKKETIKPEVILGTSTFTTAGAHTISWSGKAVYKRYEVTVNSGTVAVDLAATSPVNPTSIDFVLTGSGFSVTIKVFGSFWDTDPVSEGESIKNSNMLTNLGRTLEFVNDLVLSDAECRLIAEGFLRDFGSPKFEVGELSWPYLNLVLDQNDVTMIWSTIVFINTLYYVTSIAHHWDRADSPGDRTTYSMIDSGVTFEDVGTFTYDAKMIYERGFSYDMVFGPNAPPDETDYSYLLPVLAT